MGAGIAQVFACCDYAVTVFEPSEPARRSLHERVKQNLRMIGGDESKGDSIIVTGDFSSAVGAADFVIEAVPEKLALKQSIFRDLEQHAPPGAILASNTSVMPIHNITEGLSTADRVVGTHWWNPPFLVPLVEVVRAEKSDASVVGTVMQLLKEVGKEPALVQKDVPGFVANRLQHSLWREAIAMVREGICDAETVDRCVKNSFGMRLPVLGPLENADLVGLDLTMDIHKTIIPELDRSDAPDPYLEERVSCGELGFKNNKGFRAWTEKEKAVLQEDLINHLVETQKRRRTKS